MHSSTFFVLAAAGIAAAQSSTSSAGSSTSTSGTSGCGSQIDDIITSCLGSTQAQLNACDTNDWQCYCDQQTNVLTCYNNCPSDPRKSPAQGQLTSWCNAAKAANPSSTTSSHAVASTPKASGSSSGSSGASASPTNTESSTTASESSNPSNTNLSTASSGAAALAAAPGFLAALFGLVAIF